MLLNFGWWWWQEDIVIPSPQDGMLSPSQMERNLQVSLKGEMCFRCVAQIWWKHPQTLENEQSNQVQLFLLKTLLWCFNYILKKLSMYINIDSYSWHSIGFLCFQISYFSYFQYFIWAVCYHELISHRVIWPYGKVATKLLFCFLIFHSSPIFFPKCAERKLSP